MAGAYAEGHAPALVLYRGPKPVRRPPSSHVSRLTPYGPGMTDSPIQRAKDAARSCESAGLTTEADILYRLAETLEGQDRAAAAASLARILLAAGHVDQARPFALDGDDPVLVARLRLEAHDFAEARRLLDDARA